MKPFGMLIAGWALGLITVFVGNLLDARSVCQNVVSIVEHDVAAMVAFEEKTRPLWNTEMQKLLKTGDPKAEGGRRWLMPDMRVNSLSLGAVTGDLGQLDSKIVEQTMQFYGLTQQLNSQIVLLSGEPIRSAGRDEKKAAISENNQTREEWSKAGGELRGQLKGYGCSIF